MFIAHSQWPNSSGLNARNVREDILNVCAVSAVVIGAYGGSLLNDGCAVLLNTYIGKL